MGGRLVVPVSIAYRALIMKTQARFWAFLLAAAVAVGLAGKATGETTALDDYVAAPDPNYGYVQVDTRVGEGYSIFVVTMTSQQWRSSEEVDRVLWMHQVLIAVPWITRSGKMPKLVLNSAGGQFFLPDSSQLYFTDLLGPKKLRYTLNTDHSQAQDLRSITQPTVSWLSDVLDDKPGPQFSWTLEPNGSIRAQTFTKPKRVRLWQATNPKTRDFRLESIGAVWTSSNLSDTGNGVYVGYVPPSDAGLVGVHRGGDVFWIHPDPHSAGKRAGLYDRRARHAGHPSVQRDELLLLGLPAELEWVALYTEVRGNDHLV
jgi:PhoPQ-activated pathogenicity-related protein